MHKTTLRIATKTAAAVIALGVASLILPANVFAAGAAVAHEAPKSVGEQLLWPCINFAIYLGILTYCIRRMVNPALRARAAEVEELLQRAARDIASAKEDMRVREERRRGIASEQKLIRERIELEGVRIAEDVLRNGEQSALAARADVQKKVDQELKRATSEVRQLVVDGASKQARDTLRSSLSREDDKRLRQEAINGLFE